MTLPEPDDPNEVIKFIEGSKSDNEFYSCAFYDAICEKYNEPLDDVLHDTEESFPLDKNNGNATINIYTDDGELLYDNINGKYYE